MKSKGSKFSALASVLLVCVMMISILSACSQNSKNSGNESSAPASPVSSASKTPSSPSPSSQSSGVTLPIVAKPLTLTVALWMDATQSATMKDLNEVASIKELEKRTGIHINFITPASQDEWNLMLASGNLPDIIMDSWSYYPGGPEKALSDGVTVDLKDDIAKWAPNLQKVLSQYPDAKKQITTNGGKMFVFPEIWGDVRSRTALGPIVRKDWLDKVGLAPPTTVDGWHTMLTDFKKNDPNGNGKSDEIPLGGSQSNAIMQTMLYAMGMQQKWYQVDGQVKYGVIEPQYKNYLTTLNQWYKEGLIDPDYLVTDDATQVARITGGTEGAFENYLSRFKTYGDAMKDPKAKFIGLQYPTMQAGEQPQMSQQVAIVNGDMGMAVTSKNKHVEESVKWMDYFYSQEGLNLMNFGIEGQSYTDTDGKIQLTDAIKNNPDKLPLANAMGKYGFIFSSWPGIKPKEYIDFTTTLPEQAAAAALWSSAPNKNQWPPINPNAADASKYNNIMQGAETYSGEMSNKFIMGLEPLDKYDNFVQKLKDMGINDAIGIMQKALDSYNKR